MTAIFLYQSHQRPMPYNNLCTCKHLRHLLNHFNAPSSSCDGDIVWFINLISSLLRLSSKAEHVGRLWWQDRQQVNYFLSRILHVANRKLHCLPSCFRSFQPNVNIQHQPQRQLSLLYWQVKVTEHRITKSADARQNSARASTFADSNHPQQA